MAIPKGHSIGTIGGGTIGVGTTAGSPSPSRQDAKVVTGYYGGGFIVVMSDHPDMTHLHVVAGGYNDGNRALAIVTLDAAGRKKLRKLLKDEGGSS